MKRIVLAVAAVAAIGAFAAPASADPSICIKTDINIGGTQLPLPAETCLPPAR